MKKTLVVTVLLAAATYSGWQWFSGSSSDTADGGQLALDRLWIDHLPAHERDTLQIFAMQTELDVGIYQATSMWRGAYEVFLYEGHGDKFDLVFPQTGDRETITTHATRCNDNGMDFCLDVSGGSRGVKRYYSRKGWEINDANTTADLERRVDSIVHPLISTLPK